MAEERGVYIDIGANTKQFKEAMLDLLGWAKKLQDQIKDIDKQLKFDPNNVDLLNQRLKLLNKTIEELERDQLELNKALEEARKAMESGATEDQERNYNQLLIELSKVNVALDDYRGKLKDTENALNGTVSAENLFVGSTNQMGSSVDLLTSAFSKAGESLKNYLRKEIREYIKDVYDASLQTEYLADDLQALYGDSATSKAIQDLTNYAKDLSTTTTYTAEDIMKAMSFMARAGYDAEQTMASVKSVLDLAMATGEDVTSLASIVVDGLTAFQMEASEAERFANVLAVAANETNADVADLGESFKYAGALAGQFGYSVEDIAVALGIMASNGIKGSQAGTTLRQMFSRLAANTSHANDKLEALGVSFFDVSGNARPLLDVLEEMREEFKDMSNEDMTAALSKIAGERGISGLTAIIGASVEEWDKLKEAIKDAEGYIGEVADIKTENLQSDITKLKNSFIKLGTDAMEPLLPLGRNIVQAVTDVVNRFDGAVFESRRELYQYSSNIAELSEQFNTLNENINNNTKAFDENLFNVILETEKVNDLIQKLQEGNLEEKESAAAKKEIKEALSDINKYLDEGSYRFDQYRKVIVDEKGNVVNLTEAFSDLALEIRRAYYIEQYSQAFELAQKSEQEAIENKRKALYEYNTAQAEFNQLREEQLKYGAEFGENLSKEYNDAAVRVVELKKAYEAASTEADEINNRTRSFIVAYNGLGEASADEINAYINALNIDSAFEDSKRNLDGYLESLKEVEAYLSDPQGYELSPEEVTAYEQKKLWLEGQIQAEQDRIAKQQEYIGEAKTGTEEIAEAYSDAYNGEGGIVTTVETAQQQMKDNADQLAETQFQFLKDGFVSLMTYLQEYANMNPIVIPTSYGGDLGFGGSFSSGGWSSGGYGALNSGGHTITLNPTFNVTTPYAPTRTDLRQWSQWMLDDINDGLGRAI